MTYYDYEGKPCDLKTWCALFEDSEARRLARDEIAGLVVSTVWLGLDHSFGEGEPLLWETLVFRRDDAKEMYRYSSREEALANHARLVEQFRLLERVRL